MRKVLLCALPLLLAACVPDQSSQPVDNDYETPLFKQGVEKRDLRDFQGAIALFEEVLRINPNMAKAHLELGLMFDDKLGDYISAIYHYRKYLSLRPDGEKARFVQQWIPRAELSFASMLPNSPIENADELARLQKENLALKADLEDFQRESGRANRAALLSKAAPAESAEDVQEHVGEGLPPSKPAFISPTKTSDHFEKGTQIANTPATTSSPKPTPPPVAPAGRTHVVKAGETLWRVATKYYPQQPQEGVRKILEANKISDATKVRAGQTLSIP